MKEIITFTENALKQIELIVKSAPDGVDGIVLGVDKGGCSGYSYKLDFAKSDEIKDYDTPLVIYVGQVRQLEEMMKNLAY